MAKNFPLYAINCIKTIESHGFEAWFVGGCVRDMLLGREAFDIDIATNAMPWDVMKIFEHSIPTGIDHGTVTVVLDSNTIEVTTYRSDGKYDDNRHPNSVVFEKNIENDLSRRDFTINAFALNSKNEIIDIFGGKNDLDAKLIRCVGNAEKRFSEDALRILRGYRFCCTLGFDIEDSTLQAALKLGKSVENISGERILAELKKLITGSNFKHFLDFVNNGFLEFCGIGAINTDLKVFTDLEKSWELRLPIFLTLSVLDLSKFISVLKPDKSLINSIKALQEMSSLDLPVTKKDIKLLLFKYAREHVIMYLEYLKVLGVDTKNLYLSLKQIEENQEPYLISHLAIKGEDLMNIGITGKEIGKTLNSLCLYVIENPSKNNTDDLLKFNH